MRDKIILTALIDNEVVDYVDVSLQPGEARKVSFTADSMIPLGGIQSVF